MKTAPNDIFTLAKPFGARNNSGGIKKSFDGQGHNEEADFLVAIDFVCSLIELACIRQIFPNYSHLLVDFDSERDNEMLFILNAAEKCDIKSFHILVRCWGRAPRNHKNIFAFLCRFSAASVFVDFCVLAWKCFRRHISRSRLVVHFPIASWNVRSNCCFDCIQFSVLRRVGKMHPKQCQTCNMIHNQ